jgi:SAM-dependent methyltransferase
VRAAEIARFFEGWDLEAEERTYLARHIRRYEFLTGLVERLVDEARSRSPGEEVRVLVVGLGFEVALLRDRWAGATVESLGYPVPRLLDGRHRHVTFDLNEAGGATQPPELAPYDLIVMAEVIEHLTVPPAEILGLLRSWLEDGGRLIVQTPNPVALHKRVRMLAGRPPLGPIPDRQGEHGHWREYTARELAGAAEDAGLGVDEVAFASYIDGSSSAGRLYGAAGRLLPRSLRSGLTLTLSRR